MPWLMQQHRMFIPHVGSWETYAEPVITQGGIAYGGLVTYRVVENNEGTLREFVQNIYSDGSRCHWGLLLLTLNTAGR